MYYGFAVWVVLYGFVWIVFISQYGVVFVRCGFGVCLRISCFIGSVVRNSGVVLVCACVYDPVISLRPRGCLVWVKLLLQFFGVLCGGFVNDVLIITC